MSAFATPRPGVRPQSIRFGFSWPEHQDGRTKQPVRAGSVPEEAAEGWWRPERAGHTVSDILGCANRLMTASFSGRDKGKRRGALTLPDFNVLKALVLDFWWRKTGKLDPSYSQLQEATGHGRATIARALDRLEALGFIERLRRSRIVREGDKVVEVRQFNNAYRLAVPERLRKLLGMRAPPPIPCDQHMRNTTAFIENDEAIAAETGRPTLGSALAFLGRASRQAEFPD